MTVVLGELGGSDEYSLLESLKQGKVEKPIVARGAMSGGELESAQAKNQALRDVGAVVPTSFEALKRIKDFRSWLRKEIFRLSPRLHLPPFLKILKLPLKWEGLSSYNLSPLSLMIENFRCFGIHGW
ncbi:ATP-citrate synthase beta chain protein 1-like isoform X1 [Triticum urartu]|uniref:Uncharacterized protein n=1 Tax=Triticum urartu TaxID=4572 RepID=A0A8R7QN95_TRIUA|nr:ATP-citrate synthase beta chain protein 1-like isoform X1 [Triticum urartu]XP_048548154.1 ATP-citrate synthase beta chain protein 1-like isoform X1 [Triticum urartu]